MRNFNRIFPFIWPYRRRLGLSVLFATLVAVLWGTNLSIVFPLVKVLVQQDNLHEWVDQQIAESEARIETTATRIADLQPTRIQRRARSYGRLTSEHSRLAAMIWLQKHVLPWVPRDNFRTIALVMGLLFLATVLKGICVVIQTVLVGSVVELSTMQLRKACFRRCLDMDLQTLGRFGSSELVSRLTNDIGQLAAGLQVFGVRLIREPLKAAVCVTLAFLWNWRLALLSILVVPLIAAAFFHFGRLLKKASRAAMRSMSGIYEVLSETLGRMRVVIAFDGGRWHRREFHQQNKAYYRNSMRGVRVGALVSPTNEFLGMLGATLALLPAIYMVLRGTTQVWGVRLATQPMELADVAVLYAFLAGTLDPLHKLSSIYSQYKKATAAFDRVFELLESPARLAEPPSRIASPRLSGAVRFENVCFSYPPEDPATTPALALNNVSLSVAAGEVVAVLGDNGCGKSTLVNLLLRFADPVQGAVFVDDTDLRQFSARDLRSQVAIVMQETMLFDATIRDNILYGVATGSSADIEQAARQAHVCDYTDQLPDGLLTPVGENGFQLSGGQRQRIALARALVRNPAILILDEATSAVDAVSEKLIYESLQECCAGKTVFIVAHSLTPALMQLVSRIVVMERGQIVASGSHEELTRTCLLYRSLNKVDTPTASERSHDGAEAA